MVICLKMRLVLEIFMQGRDDSERIVITGVGLASPNGDNLAEFRNALLNGVSGVVPYEIRYFGKTVAGVCHCDITKYRPKREIRRGTLEAFPCIVSARRSRTRA